MNILEIEKKSFYRYSKKVGIEPQTLLNRLKVTIQSRFYSLDKNSKGAYQSQKLLEQYGLDLDNFTLQNFLEAGQKSIKVFCDESINNIEKYFKKNGKFYKNEIDLIRKNALKSAIDCDASENWLSLFLKTIPVIQSFDFDLEAYVKQSESEYSIIFNRTINDLSERYLLPTVINTLFKTMSSGEVASQDFLEKVFLKSAKGIAELAKLYEDGIKTEKMLELDMDKELSEISEIVSISIAAMNSCVVQFILLHEYSHVILNHIQSDNYHSNEVQADILAFNILLDSVVDFVKCDKLSAIFQVISPLIFINFLVVIDAVKGFSISKSHPHPFARLVYLSIMSREYMQQSFHDYCYTLFEVTASYTYLFSKTMQLFYNPTHLMKEIKSIDLKFLNNIDFKLIHNGKIFQLRNLICKI
ncbi:MAG: hypothetical protein K9K75_01775 [Deltaproteobacteria bacterium]|nr:hypothetical protein [Deltaproteobacteria bacterium]